eukprot:TRINITY_DN4568_c0_g1_i4.p1 TRINITY_DN4568_c0_g1~~TRINITY_DN4568_c0_g1_i4.p1  ORF type:complete len:251 (-),score=79.89 TRINITY_DN4568_c0_g1_i4:550-1302(-)
MGNDGGSIPGRKDLVREKPKEVKVDDTVLARSKGQLCSMTKERLKTPIAMCRTGLLYNKESVLKALLEKNIPNQFDHIKKLKDIRTVKFAENVAGAEFPLICPISKTEYNGLNVFLALWNCGCVFSEKAFNAIKGKENKCISCGEPYKAEDIINLNLSQKEQAPMRAKLVVDQTKKKKSSKEESKGESKPSKKVKLDEDQAAPVAQNILEKINEESDKYPKSNVYRSLFHKEHSIDEKKLMYLNVRHGIR